MGNPWWEEEIKFYCEIFFIAGDVILIGKPKTAAALGRWVRVAGCSHVQIMPSLPPPPILQCKGPLSFTTDRGGTREGSVQLLPHHPHSYHSRCPKNKILLRRWECASLCAKPMSVSPPLFPLFSISERGGGIIGARTNIVSSGYYVAHSSGRNERDRNCYYCEEGLPRKPYLERKLRNFFSF